MTLTFSLLSAALLTRSLVAASTFSTNCSVPLERVTFVTSANTRGTLDILFGSLFTIFICIWTVQHLNVPEQRDGWDQHWRGDIKWALKGPQKKAKWMLLTLLAPEVLLAKACSDLATARWSVTKVRTVKDKAWNLLPESEVANWTMSHAYYADMGGFFFRTAALRENGIKYKLQHLTSSSIFKLRSEGCISTLPPITKDQIMDKSKGDFIVKATAVLQVSWMVIQVIVRAARGLPISQLEITTCAFAACTFVTYALWWNKPQAVTACTEIHIDSRENWPSDLNTLQEASYWSIFSAFVLPSQIKYLKKDMPIPNDALVGETYETYGFATIGISLGCLLLGAIHCAAWNFYLPTRTEQLLWRCISLVSCFLIPVYLLLVISIFKLKNALGLRFIGEKNVLITMAGVCNVIYIACRLFLLFESIWSLFHLPPGAFVTTWASNIPHI